MYAETYHKKTRATLIKIHLLGSYLKKYRTKYSDGIKRYFYTRYIGDTKDKTWGNFGKDVPNDVCGFEKYVLDIIKDYKSDELEREKNNHKIKTAIEKRNALIESLWPSGVKLEFSRIISGTRIEELKGTPGVYFLWNTTALEYIGQSKNVYKRLLGTHHIFDNHKRTNYFIGIVQESEEDRRRETEMFFVGLLQPTKNKTLKNPENLFAHLAASR